MKLRCLPPSRQKGLRALTTPAPFVQRLPAPPANETTATIPAASASLPISWYFGAASLGGIKEIVRANVGDPAAGGKTILRQAHAAAAQVRLDLLMLHAIEPVGFEQRVEALGAVGFLRALRDQVLEDVLHHALEFRHGVAGGGEALQFERGARAKAGGIPCAGARARPAGSSPPASARSRLRRSSGLRALFVDREIVDHGLHGEGHGSAPSAAWCRS